MKKKCFADAECPLARAYAAIGDWWSLLILSNILLAGLRRFGEIQQQLGMARNILTARLGKLVEEGILEKVPASDGSNYQEYAPTEMGKDLLTAVVALRQWGEKHYFRRGECTNTLVSRKRNEAVPLVTVRDSRGRELEMSDLRLIELD